MNQSERKNNEEDNSEPLSPDLYQKVIYPHRHFFGLWRIDINTYGGLLLVKCVSDTVEGWEMLAPSINNFTENLRIKPLFKICLSGNKQGISCFCLGHPRNKGEGQHKALLKMSRPDAFEFKCSLPETHVEPRRKRQDFLDWLQEEKGTENSQSPESDNSERYYDAELLHKKFTALRKCNYHYHFKRLDLSFWDKGIGCTTKPVQPGIFKGTYSSHGVELVELTYVKDNTGDIQAKAWKITGDDNVPAGRLTFKANLCYPIHFETMEEQDTIDKLERLEYQRVPYLNNTGHPSAQPFSLPYYCTTEYGLKIPDVCIYRFTGIGQIADEGFTNPQGTEGQWVVFDEDLFGFLWISLCSLTLYHRVKDFNPDPPNVNSF